MTLKEAWNGLLERIKNYAEIFEDKEEQQVILKQLDIIRPHLVPPTVEEVCKALSEYLQTVYGKVVIYYENKNFGMEIQHSVDEITSHELVSLLSDNIIYIGENLPPHLITLIGRFYQSLEEELK